MLSRITISVALIVIASSSTLIAQESRATGNTLNGQISGQVRYAEGASPPSTSW